jgi:hypothetical protein
LGHAGRISGLRQPKSERPKLSTPLLGNGYASSDRVSLSQIAFHGSAAEILVLAVDGLISLKFRKVIHLKTPSKKIS